MKKISLLFLLLLIVSCSNKPKSVYWCGDHACKNEKERVAYFKKTMIVEVRELDKSKNIAKLKKTDKKIKLSQTAKKNVPTDPLKTESEENIELHEEEKKEIRKEVKKEIASIQNKKNVKEKISKKNITKKELSKPELINQEFDDIVKMITNKNKDKPFPDINDFPN